MEQNIQNKRVRRTITLLEKSLAELMRTKHPKEITVKELTERAGLNRGTFYLHFRDIDDFIEQVTERKINDILNVIKENYPQNAMSSFYYLCLEILHYIKANEEVCTSIFLHPTDSALKRFRDTLKEKEREGLTLHFGQHSFVDYDYFLTFATNGIIGMIEQWVTSNDDVPIEVMAKLMDEFVCNGRGALLSHRDFRPIGA